MAKKKKKKASSPSAPAKSWWAKAWDDSKEALRNGWNRCLEAVADTALTVADRLWWW